MKILICGGAGYIGSHIAKAATEAGHKITIVDNLVTGHKESIPGLPFHQGNIGDLTFMESVLKGARYDLVMHFCAFSLNDWNVISSFIPFFAPSIAPASAPFPTFFALSTALPRNKLQMLGSKSLFLLDFGGFQ